VALSRTQTADFVELTKPRIVLMVMVTAAAGFWMAGPVLGQAMGLFHLLVGTMLVAGGANALNQVIERDVDANMRRTQNRPLPTGRVEVGAALAFALLIGVGGVLYLGATLNSLTAALAALTLASYAFVYTPLKRKTNVATLIGGIPGALPIVGGWTAVTGVVHAEAWILFWILFLWQLPHFLALGWLFRDQYRQAGFKMLSDNDPEGHVTFLNATVYAAALVPVSIAPTVLGMTGGLYFVGSLLLSGWFVALAVRAFRRRDDAGAKSLFKASLVYLPALLLLMSVNRIG